MTALILCLVGGLMWMGHYAPWRLVAGLVDESQRLRRELAYVYGCLILWLGFLTWALCQSGTAVNPWRAVEFLGLEILAAGLGTLAPRALELALETKALREDVRDLETGGGR